MGRSDFRNFLKDKKGVELTLNTVIIAILVVLVLIVVIGFFLGGTSKAKNTISDIFSAGIAGSDFGLAVQQCENYCDQAKDWSPALKEKSPYCTKAFNLDIEGTGEAKTHINGEKKVANSYYCGGTTLSIPCPELESACGNKEDVTAA
ncbi:hypothetical protein HOF78_00375 [Candidatus Woesearchaeota archaeon]|jgi:hypothetical protein|nr:hypothetical protein [Candidatus Woesearchaeota archaeon]MBT6044578.1 hypothetical protein [Candidatus Woesearchaeota archaeon]